MMEQSGELLLLSFLCCLPHTVQPLGHALPALCRWANNRILQAASTLSAKEFTRDLGGSFPSVRDTLVHIVGCESGWLTCWKEPSSSTAFVTDLWTRLNALLIEDRRAI
jgi:hypothetical protein